MSDQKNAIEKRIQHYANAMVEGSPFAHFLNIQLIEVTRTTSTLSVDYREDLIGDSHKAIIHGGVITSLLDHASGVAAFAAMGAEMSVATLDLRIDYMRSANPGSKLIGKACCYKTSTHIAFVRSEAHDDQSEKGKEPVAIAQSAFMVLSLNNNEKNKYGAKKI